MSNTSVILAIELTQGYYASKKWAEDDAKRASMKGMNNGGVWNREGRFQ